MQTSGSGQTTLLFVVIVISAFLVRQGRNNPAAVDLDHGQRIRPLLLEWLDPVIPVVAIGALLLHDLEIGIAQVASGVVGAAIGIGIGLVRSRVMFVRALGDSKSVVLVRSTIEYLMISLLIVLRLAEGPLSRVHETAFTLTIVALLSMSLAESIARSINITIRYHRSALAELEAHQQ